MAGSSIVVSVLADTKNLSAGLAGASNDASKFGGVFKKVAIGGGLAVAALGLGVGKFIASSISAAGESEKVAAQTAAVVKSTGGVAGRSAAQIGDLATKLSNLTGIDDEVVQGAENIVATFTNIRGKQFDETTKAALDMSVALGTDAKSAAMTLGKALNDPEKGLSKLSKQGVTFTAGQKEQVAALVKTGDTAKAQAVILAEVSKEFGGSAEAFGATFDGTKEKIGNAFGNIQETIGGAFLPVLTLAGTKVATFLQNLGGSEKFAELTGNVAGFVTSLLSGNNVLGPFIGRVASVVSQVSPLAQVFSYVSKNLDTVLPPLQALGSAFASTFVALLPTITSLATTFGGVLTTVIAAVMPVILQLVGQFASTLTTLLPVIAQVASTLGATLGTVLTTLAPVIAQIVSALGPVLMAVLSAVLPIITLLASTFSTLLVALMPIITQALLPLVSAVLSLIAPLLQLIGPILVPLIALFKAVLTPVLGLVKVLVGLLVPVLTLLVKAISFVISIIAGGLTATIRGISALFSGGFSSAISRVGSLWSSVWNGIKAVFMLQVNAVRAGVSALVGFFSGVWGSITSGISGFASSVGAGIGAVVSTVTALPGKITSALGNLGSLLFNSGKSIVQGLIDGIGAMVGAAGNAISGVMSKISSFLPHSPAKDGPFSGRGWTLYSGIAIGDALAKGMNSRVRTVSRAARGMVSAASLSGFDNDLAIDPTAGSLRGGTTVHHVTLNVPMLTPGPEAGRVITSALDDYFRVSGRRVA